MGDSNMGEGVGGIAPWESEYENVYGKVFEKHIFV